MNGTSPAPRLLPLSSFIAGMPCPKIALMRITERRFGRSTLVAALSAALAIGLSACDQASTAEGFARRTQGAESAASNAQVLGVAPAAARVPVDDKTLAVNVKAALMASAALNATTIEVSAKEGIVTLSGTTNTSTRRDLAGYLALRVDGVTAVRNRIAVISSS